MKIYMNPMPDGFGEESGIRRVVENYVKHLPSWGVEFVDQPDKADLRVGHAGSLGKDLDVHVCHGLYWSADMPDASWELKENAKVILSLRHALEVTVPSPWVAHNIARDMKFLPHIVPHGIDWDDWQHDLTNRGFVLWNKNRISDACDPWPMYRLAEKFPHVPFVTTFLPEGAPELHNITVTGLLPHDKMKGLVQACGVYLSTTKETWCLGALEAMAAGKPVLALGVGAVPDLVSHGVNGFLYPRNNQGAIEEGLTYCIEHADTLGDNSREIAKKFTWQKACEKLYGVLELALDKK